MTASLFRASEVTDDASADVMSAAWGRRSLQLTMALAALVAVALGLGVGALAWGALSSQGVDATHTSVMAPPAQAAASAGEQVVRGQAYRDAITKAAMVSAGPLDPRPSAVTVPLRGAIEVPAPTRVGAQGVATGFPRSPQGALGQLAAIETTVLEAMSLQVTSAVHNAWTAPGGPSLTEWDLTRQVRAFLDATGSGTVKDVDTTLSVTPVGAQIKGVDGPDWTAACVLIVVRAVRVQEAKIAYGSCAAMQWMPGGAQTAAEGRWVLSPGPPAAPAPSTWPGSEIAVRAGWSAWTVEPDRDAGQTSPATTPAKVSE